MIVIFNLLFLMMIDWEWSVVPWSETLMIKIDIHPENFPSILTRIKSASAALKSPPTHSFGAYSVIQKGQSTLLKTSKFKTLRVSVRVPHLKLTNPGWPSSGRHSCPRWFNGAYADYTGKVASKVAIVLSIIRPFWLFYVGALTIYGT